MLGKEGGWRIAFIHVIKTNADDLIPGLADGVRDDDGSFNDKVPEDRARIDVSSAFKSRCN